MRIDKYLWCVRLARTRSTAAELCTKGHIQLNDRTAKPAHSVAPGDRIQVRAPGADSRYTVLSVPTARVGAALVGGLLRNDTSPEAQAAQSEAVERRKNARPIDGGRPTKMDRRQLDRLFGGGDG